MRALWACSARQASPATLGSNTTHFGRTWGINHMSICTGDLLHVQYGHDRARGECERARLGGVLAMAVAGDGPSKG